MPLIRSANYNLFVEILIRIALFSVFCYMETLTPFQRVIQPSELHTSLHYPRRDSYVTGGMLWGIVLAVPCLLSVLAWGWYNDCNDALEILLTWSMSVGLTGCITNTFKLIVGRPRPDFFYRCFPDGVEVTGLSCTGDPDVIMEGRKSFPSGHSSLSWSSLGVCALYAYGRRGPRSGVQGGGALIAIAPLLLASIVAMSRTCDYHHHWEDVLAGSMLGMSIAVYCYRQYYNPVSSDLSGVPYVVSDTNVARYVNGKFDSPSKDGENSPLLTGRKEDKWI